MWDRVVSPIDAVGAGPLKGEAGIRHGLRTRGCDLRTRHSHANPPRFERRRGAYRCVGAALQRFKATFNERQVGGNLKRQIRMESVDKIWTKSLKPNDVGIFVRTSRACFDDVAAPFGVM